MSSIKIILLKKKKTDATHPLALRIIRDRKPAYIFLGHRVKEADWNSDAQEVRSSHPNSKRLNAFLLKKRIEATDSSLELESQKTEVSARAVKQKIKPQSAATFFAQAEIWLSGLKQAGKYNQYNSEKPRIKHFRAFLKGDDIAFPDVTVGMLSQFRNYLKGERNIKERTVVNHLMAIRSVFSFAIASQVTDERYYPFGRNKVKVKFPESLKIGLSVEEIKRLESVALHDKYADHCRKLFLFSFYFAGARVSDVLRLRFSDFQDRRLYYAMGKNNKAGSVKIPEKAGNILDHYAQFRANNDDLVFPELKRLNSLENKYETQRAIAYAVNRIDKCLRKTVAPAAGIDKKLTMHIARHSFGNIAGDRITVQMLQKLYRHAKLETTIGYQGNHIHKDADAALDAVLNF